MTRKRKQDDKLVAVASVMEVIGKLTGDQALTSEAVARKSAATMASKASRKVSVTPK